MKIYSLFLLLFSIASFSQNKTIKPLSSKGEHYALYNKCKTAVTFCEITQQNYTSCGSVKNCYGLYVMPGDTFFINIEDKNQAEGISADVSFGGYFPSITSFSFQPIDINCMPQQALQITIPLTATIGSSFQIVSQNVTYTNPQSSVPGIPAPFSIYVGGQQPQFTFALSDFTTCPFIQDVSINEIGSGNNATLLFPNPSDGILSVLGFNNKVFDFEVFDLFGSIIYRKTNQLTNTIDLTSLNNGIYFLKLTTKNNSITSEKLILLK